MIITEIGPIIVIHERSSWKSTKNNLSHSPGIGGWILKKKLLQSSRSSDILDEQKNSPFFPMTNRRQLNGQFTGHTSTQTGLAVLGVGQIDRKKALLERVQQRSDRRWNKKMIKQAKIQGTYKKPKMPGSWIH